MWRARRIGAGTLATHAQQANAALQQTSTQTTAQTTTTHGDAGSPQPLQTVVVTGTLIARPAAETAEAITISQATAIKDAGPRECGAGGGPIARTYPASISPLSVGSFTGGGTYANLRGLGTGRTLVLLDGQRLANNAINGNAVDLSGIPFSAIDSIQVLREGASSLYGSDAIAGVINFITKKNYQGGEVELNLNHPQERGGGSAMRQFTFGHGDLVSDGYNFMITGSYSEQQELRATQRSFSAEGFDPALGVAQTNGRGNVARDYHRRQRHFLAARLSGLRRQSLVDHRFRQLRLPVFRRDGLCCRSRARHPGWPPSPRRCRPTTRCSLQYFYTPLQGRPAGPVPVLWVRDDAPASRPTTRRPPG